MRPAQTLLSVVLATLVTTCDPGASFELADSNAKEVSWIVAGDSVHGRVWANAFTIDLDVDAVLDAPNSVELLVDSANLAIYGVDGIALTHDSFKNVCDDTTTLVRTRTRRCTHGRVNLHSTDYDPLDSLTVRFGFAAAGGQLVPLTARFVRRR